MQLLESTRSGYESRLTLFIKLPSDVPSSVLSSVVSTPLSRFLELVAAVLGLSLLAAPRRKFGLTVVKGLDGKEMPPAGGVSVLGSWAEGRFGVFGSTAPTLEGLRLEGWKRGLDWGGSSEVWEKGTWAGEDVCCCHSCWIARKPFWTRPYKL